MNNTKIQLKFDNLVTDKIPIFLIEKSSFRVENKTVVAINNEEKQEIPIQSIHLICLGNGVSITSEVANLCAKYRCFISFSKGGLNNHSYWNLGQYKDPEPTILQSLCQFDDEKRLRYRLYA